MHNHIRVFTSLTISLYICSPDCICTDLDVLVSDTVINSSINSNRFHDCMCTDLDVLVSEVRKETRAVHVAEEAQVDN
jgi:hypothetical protein